MADHPYQSYGRHEPMPGHLATRKQWQSELLPRIARGAAWATMIGSEDSITVAGSADTVWHSRSRLRHTVCDRAWRWHELAGSRAKHTPDQSKPSTEPSDWRRPSDVLPGTGELASGYSMIVGTMKRPLAWAGALRRASSWLIAISQREPAGVRLTPREPKNSQDCY